MITILSVLGGTIGAGNVAGVASAIAIGGPGALSWMWLIAILSMGTKFVEVFLAVKYKEKDSNGKYIGGPMYYIKRIKGKIGKILAFFYGIALLTYVLCDSGFVQINTISSSLNDTFNLSPWIIVIILVLISLIIIYGGLKRVSNVLEKVVPIMCVIYVVSALIVIGINYANIPHALKLIIKYAFKPAPIIGGFAGATIVQTISKGASRGIFANEAGLGTSTTVHVTSDNKPLVQGMWGIVEVAVVSFIMCTISGLLVLVTNSWSTGLDGAPMILNAFNEVYGSFGKYVLCFVIVTFSYSTYIGFYYEYITCIKYLLKEKWIKVVKWLYLLPIIPAILTPIEMVWNIADIAVGFIIIPNVIALLILGKEAKFEKV